MSEIIDITLLLFISACIVVFIMDGNLESKNPDDKEHDKEDDHG